MPRNNKNTSPAIIPKPTLTVTNTRPTLGQTMKEGFGLGVGVSVAQHTVNGVMNLFSGSKPVENTKVDNTKLQEYEKCMKYNSNDSDLCKMLLDN